MSRMRGYRWFFSVGLPFEALTRDIWLICLSNVIGAFGEGLYFWVFPLYIKSLQADYVQLGLVFSILYGVAALGPLPGGLLADRFDRKKLLILSWAPWVFAPLIYSFAQNWTQLIPGAICWGASMIGAPVVTAYVISSVDDKRKLASVLTFVWSTYSFSYIFAPAIGGYLATIVGMQWVLRFSTVLAAASTLVFFLLRSQHPRRNETRNQQRSSPSIEEKSLWRKMLLWAVFLAATSFFMSIARPYVATFLDEQINLSKFQVGIFGSVNFAGITFIGVAMGRLGDRWRKSGAMSLCLLLYVVSIVPLLIIREAFSLMSIAFVLGGSAVLNSLVSSFVGMIAPEHKQGLWVSIPQTLSLFATFAAPYLGGYLYSSSPYYPFIVSASGIPFLALVGLTKLRD